jgi:hypothetical protein
MPVTTTDFNINQKFDFLKDLTSMVVNDITPSMVVVGEGGLGKTHSVKTTIAENGLETDDYVLFKGYSTARGLYNTLFDNNGKLIVFDDCDSVLEDKVALNILKSALDSYDTREISWMAKMNKGDVYPNQFIFYGRIIFISNKNKESLDEALLSRSLTVDLSMTTSEKIERMEFILEDILPDYPMDVKTDALNFLNENKDNCQLNMRTLIKISKLRITFPDTWTNLANFMIKS